MTLNSTKQTVKAKANQPVKPFTGKHFFALMVMGFGLVILVNLLMVKFAITGFGGTIVDNSYVASQKFNQWLDAATIQQQAGWRSNIGLDQSRRIIVTLSYPPNVKLPERVNATATEVISGKSINGIELDLIDDGRYQSRNSLRPGRYKISFNIGVAKFAQTIG